MRGSKPDVAVHQLSYALPLMVGQTNSANATERTESGDGAGEKPSRKAIFDRTAAEAAPVVGVAVFRHTRKRVGLGFGNLPSGSSTSGSGGSGENGNEKHGFAQQPGKQRWETMRQLDVTGAKYAVTFPPAEELKRTGAEIYPPIPSQSTTIPRSLTTPWATQDSPEILGAEKEFWAGFDWSIGSATSPAALAMPKQCPEVQVVSTTTNPFRSHTGSRTSSSSDTAAAWHSTTHAQQNNSSISRDDNAELIWKRTHSTSSGLRNAAIYRRLSLANWKLVDELDSDNKKVRAVFESNGLKSFRKRGVLRIYWHGLDEDEWQVFVRGVVLSYCVLEEKLRRS
jgi:hypothetical protein